MGVRHLEELGPNMQKIMTRLLANQNLLKLLYYTDKDPLGHDDFSASEIEEKFFNTLIKVVPRVTPNESESGKSIIAMRVTGGTLDEANDEFQTIQFGFEVFVPMTNWLIKDSNMRPFAILGEIHDSLYHKKIDGFGKINGGDFELSFLTEEVACYIMEFSIESYA